MIPATLPRPRARHRRQQGASLLELAIVIILFSLMLLVAIDRLLPLRGQAEAAAVLSSQGNMQARLGGEVAQRVIRDGLPAVLALEGSNPMALIETPPPTYRGAFARIDLNELQPGDWAFDRSRGVLVYRVQYAQYFDGEPSDPPRAEWRIELHFAEGTGREPEALREVLLVPLGKPSWRLQSGDNP
ncbi:MAG TPA: type II secretion system protein [Arenimonas sp.]|nr:type II secretion system protein [Arenimonas sp.]